MAVLHQEVRVFEGEIEDFNRRPLGLKDLKTVCDGAGLLLLIEPFPGQGLYFNRLGVPVLTVNRRLEPAAGSFFGFWGLFLHRLKPGATCFFRNWRELDDPVLVQAGLLASVALIPTDRLLEPLPAGLREGPASSLISRLITRRIRILIQGDRVWPLEQAL